MSEELGVAIMMNNYFHDVATAMLLSSGFVRQSSGFVGESGICHDIHLGDCIVTV